MSPSALTSLARPTAPGAIKLSQLARLFSEGDEQLPQENTVRRRRREELFRESIVRILRRNALSAAYALHPERAGGVLPMAALLLRDAVAPRAALPDPRGALANPDGFCGVARDLSVNTLT